ncbi:MAG: winged helix-turn-helix transcriptional regulator [Rubrobacteridae bacterium]|nr:winged helix-turn-helix transcriptional regulator [Rubrobacteridae bacterium]
MLDALFRSRVMVKLLAYFLRDTKKEGYLREVGREIGEPASAVQREMQKLEEFGIVAAHKRGNHRYYSIQEEFPLLPELKNLFLKSEGAEDYLKDSLRKLNGIQLAFAYGEYAEKPSLMAELKIVIIGEPEKDAFDKFMNTTQATLRRRISYQIYKPEEFGKLLEEQDPSLNHVLGGEKLILVANVAEKAAVH